MIHDTLLNITMEGGRVFKDFYFLDMVEHYGFRFIRAQHRSGGNIHYLNPFKVTLIEVMEEQIEKEGRKQND